MTLSHIVVRFCETDLMGIVHHANYLHYFEIGRVDWLKARGVSYESWVARGVHLPVVDVKIRYRKAARFDDALVLETRVMEVSRVTVRFGYRLVRERDDAVLCEPRTPMVWKPNLFTLAIVVAMLPAVS